MKLTELFLNRFLYRDNTQNLETKDSVFVSTDSTPAEPSPIYSGGAAQDINTGNVFINGAQLEPGTIPQTVLDVSNWGWGQTCAFSSTDLNTVSWGAGTFKSADGTSYSISAGNTGNMAAKTYIYLDLLTSTTAYQITTTPGNAVGVGKVLVAVANPDSGGATYNLSEATQIVGDNIIANTIDASKLSVGQLSAITADLGTITSGLITGATIRTNDATYPYAVLNSSGVTVNGTGFTLQNSTGGAASYIGVSGNDLVFSPFGDFLINGGAGGVTLKSYGYTVLNAEFDNIYVNNAILNSVYPSADNYYSLGTGTNLWASVYSQKHYFGDSNYLAYNDANSISSNCNLVPSSNLVASLGSSALRWYSAYLQEINLNKIHINSSVLLPSSGGDIVNYSYLGVDQFRGQPGAGTWTGSFDMSAY